VGGLGRLGWVNCALAVTFEATIFARRSCVGWTNVCIAFEVGQGL
jgi:hypothetical protein